MLVGEYPDRRFVKLRMPARQHKSLTFTFLAADPAANPTPDNHGVLAKLAEADPQRAQRVAERLRTLIAREHEVFTWLETHPNNSTLFTQDPKAALRQALPDLDPAFFDGWVE